MTELRVGTIEHYYPKAHAAVVAVETGTLKVGDQIHIAGAHDDLWEEVTSLELDHTAIEKATRGQKVGLLVDGPVHAGSEVLKVTALEG